MGRSMIMCCNREPSLPDVPGGFVRMRQWSLHGGAAAMNMGML